MAEEAELVINSPPTKMKQMQCCALGWRKWTIFSLGTLFALVAVFLLIFWKQYADNQINEQLQVASNVTTEYQMWVETPIPMYMAIYLFNWTNADEVLRSKWTIKPRFEERGPYTFAEKHYRKEVVFNANHTLTYKTQRVWHLVPELTNGTLDDEITTLNTILLAVGEQLKFKSIAIKLLAELLFKEQGTKFTTTKTVREFLFEGYDDPLLDLLKKLPIDIKIPFPKLGWFYGRNGSIDYDGVYNMFDGSDSVSNLGRFHAWNYNTTTRYYPGECGKIKGTSGELWYPVRSDPSVEIFSSDTCSTLSLTRHGEESKLGITGHKFIGTEALFDNGTKYPDSACYSLTPGVRSGVRNISECKFGAPVFISYPHFYLGDDFYRESIDGMAPNPSKHQLYLTLEPTSGIPIEANFAVQVNLRVQAISLVSLFADVKEHYMPVLWFKNYAQIDAELAKQARLVILLPSLGGYIAFTLLGIGSLLFIAFGVLLYRSRSRSEEEEPLLSSPPTNT